MEVPVMLALCSPPDVDYEPTPSEWLTPDYEPDPGDGCWLTEDEDPPEAEDADQSTPVHPSQTNVVQSPTAAPADTSIRPDVAYRFRAPQHKEAYTLTLALMQSYARHADRARRLSLCGAHATVWHSPSTDTVAVRSYHCGMRCCPRCRETHSAKTRETLDRFLANVEPTRLSMITLTLAHTEDTLSVQIDHLYKSFRRLRASKTWKRFHPKGYAVCEVSRSTDQLSWHPHLHLLAETPYIPDDQLKAAWHVATGTSYIVDIRRINRKAIARHRDYLTDYLTKPASVDVLRNPELLIEWIDAFAGRHVLIKFGRPTLADKPPPPEDPQDWSLIGSLIGLLAGFRRGNKRAISWLARIGKGPTVERRDIDAGKDYSIDPAYKTPDTPQYFA
jgi:hypothetical protein